MPAFSLSDVLADSTGFVLSNFVHNRNMLDGSRILYGPGESIRFRFFIQAQISETPKTSVLQIRSVSLDYTLSFSDFKA